MNLLMIALAVLAIGAYASIFSSLYRQMEVDNTKMQAAILKETSPEHLRSIALALEAEILEDSARNCELVESTVQGMCIGGIIGGNLVGFIVVALKKARPAAPTSPS